MLDSGSAGGATLLKTTIKAALAIGALSLLASNWLSSGDFDRRSLSVLAESISGRTDPTMTGSVARSAQATVLDPCRAESRR